MSESEDYTWIIGLSSFISFSDHVFLNIDAVVEYIQSPGFRDPISSYITRNCTQFCDKATAEEQRVSIFNGYVTLYNDSISSLFQSLGVPEEQVQPAWNYLLTSQEGMSDTSISSEFLSAENFNIFANLMEYYQKRLNFGQARVAKVCISGLTFYCLSLFKAKPEDLQVAAQEMELAEVRLALILSEEIAQRISQKESKPKPKAKAKAKGKSKAAAPKAKAGGKPPYAKPSGAAPPAAPPYALPATTAAAAAAAGEAFKTTSTPLRPKAQRVEYQQMDAGAVAQRKMKLKEMEQSLLQQLEGIRSAQEKQTMVCSCFALTWIFPLHLFQNSFIFFRTSQQTWLHR